MNITYEAGASQMRYARNYTNLRLEPVVEKRQQKLKMTSIEHNPLK